MYKVNLVIVTLLFLSASKAIGQTPIDSSMIKKEYSNLEQALENPEKVYRLNLSNQVFKMPSDSIWARFTNLEYLSFKNDHLTTLPYGIGNLKNLKILDLSGNDFKILPESFSRLESLTEIYLNDEKKMDTEQSMLVIKDLPNLKILHLENDHLHKMPNNLLQFTHLEVIYLNNNKFKELPIMDLNRMNTLKYIDLNHNKFQLNKENLPPPGTGFTIRF